MIEKTVKNNKKVDKGVSKKIGQAAKKIIYEENLDLKEILIRLLSSV